MHPTLDVELLEIDFTAISLLSDEQAAEILQARMGAWDTIDDLHERSFVDRGRIALEFQKRELWRFEFSSFEAWMCSGRGGSRATKYAALKAVNHLVNVSPKTLEQIPRCNIYTLVGVSSAVRELPEVLEAAKGSEDSFTDYLAQNHPQQHIESTTRLLLKPTRGARKVIDQAFELVMAREGCTTREECLEMICAAYVADCETEDRFRQAMSELNAPACTTIN